ncbi:Membrane protease family protein HP0248 [hydrothermal vent metagenome]|uniref:Membrane protease family protein HP0248 n=1 Tax=hydrothermal vent metagenome TaxID=652676 RepID=A0A1W1D451_9ZZZZ
MASDMNDYFNKKRSESSNNSPSKGPDVPNFNMSGKKAGVVYVVLALALLLVVAKPFMIIEEGERGILSTNGKYQEQPLLPGLHFIIPLIQKVYVVDTRVRLINYTSHVDATIANRTGINIKPAITVLDKRGLPVSIELTVQYRLNAKSAARTISNWGFSWEEKIINPVVRDIVRNVIGKYDAESLPHMRSQIAKEIDMNIRNKIESLEDNPVTLESIQLRKIILPERVKKQIENVQVAKQEVQKARQQVEKAKQEALKHEAEAQGIAQKKRIEAQGMADATMIEAQAKAKANALIAKSLTKELLELEQIKVQGKFNEALRENKDAKIFLTPGGSTPNIWVDTKDIKKQTVAK